MFLFEVGLVDWGVRAEAGRSVGRLLRYCRWEAMEFRVGVVV